MFTALVKLCLDDNQDVFFFAEYDSPKNLILRILNVNLNEAYYADVGDIELRSQAASLRMTFSDYVSSLTDALFQNVGREEYVYCLEKISDQSFFKWKRKDDEGTAIVLGRILVVKKHFIVSLTDVLKVVSEQLFNYQKKISSLETTLKNNENEKAEALSALSTAVEAKDRLEKEMYSKFVLVLNQKKSKIRELKLERHSDVNEASKKSTCIKSKKAKKRTAYHDVSDSSEEVDGDTLRPVKNEPGPSNTDQNNSLIFVDEPEFTISVSPSKVRNRNTANRVKNTKEQSKPQPLVKQELLLMDSESDDDLLKNM